MENNAFSGNSYLDQPELVYETPVDRASKESQDYEILDFVGKTNFKSLNARALPKDANKSNVQMETQLPVVKEKQKNDRFWGSINRKKFAIVVGGILILSGVFLTVGIITGKHLKRQKNVKSSGKV